MSQAYTQSFYEATEARSRTSARAILPIVIELLNPGCVVDVGCGTGAWLEVATELGVADVTGIDGDWVARDRLRFPADRFFARDLTQPLGMNGTFDLALSLEVAEHLQPEHADGFVAALCALSPAILFSAAIPGQGGVRHLNEQWPEFWVERFESRGYVALDCIRPKVWRNRDIYYWYAQNTLLLMRRERIEGRAALEEAWRRTERGALSRVHPERYEILMGELERACDPETKSFLDELRLLPHLGKRAIVRHLCRLLGSREPKK